MYLWELIRDVFQTLGRSEIRRATGGSTTTVVDSTIAGEGKDDDYKDGTVIIISAGGAAPEGEFKRLASSTDTTGTMTFESAMTAAPASGDEYMLVDSYFTLRNMIRLINLALQKLGPITLTDTTTLDSASDQTEYTASVAWKREVLRVDIQTNSDSDANLWKELRDWEYIPAAGGSTGLIEFRSQPDADKDLRIWYKSTHPTVSDYDDVINEGIEPVLAIAAVAVEALNWQNNRLMGNDKNVKEQLNYQMALLEQHKKDFPLSADDPPQKAKIFK